MTSKRWRSTNALISETLIKRDIFCDDVYCRKKLLKRALEEDDEVGPEISWFQCFIGVFILTFNQFTFALSRICFQCVQGARLTVSTSLFHFWKGKGKEREG